MNIYIVFDFLLKYSPQIVVNDPEQVEISIDFAEELSNSTAMRIVSSAELCADFTALSGRTLVIVGKVDDYLLSMLKANVIVISDDTLSVETVVSTLFERYQNYISWQERLLLALVDGANLCELFAIGAEAFSNPIFLEDMESRLMCECGMERVGSDKPFLYELYQKGFVDTEDFIKYGSLSEENALFQTPDMTPAFLDAHGDNCTLLVTYISIGGQRFAAFQVIQLDHDITPGCAEYARFFSEILAKYFSRTFDDISNAKSYKSTISDIINGVSVSKETLNQLLDVNHWAQNDEYTLAVIEWGQEVYGTPYTRQRLLLDLKGQFPKAAIDMIENRFYVMMNARDTENTAFKQELLKAAEKNHLHIAISQPFFDILSVQKYYLQSVFGLKLAVGEPLERVLGFDDYAPALIENFLGAAQNVCGSIIIPQLEMLCDTENSKSGNYIETLYMYLSSGMNLSTTAARLQIHRNTLTYRLDRIESVLGYKINKDEISDTEILEFLISCYLITDGSKRNDQQR